MKRASSVDEYISNAQSWQPELNKLRDILCSCDLEEGVKWGAPCYMSDGKNVVGIGAFKSYFGLWFFQGALLADKSNKLINAQEGKTKALRQWRMESSADIKPSVIKSYVKESIRNLRSGKSIESNHAKPVVVPVELQFALKKNRKTSEKFEAMRPGLRREYADYIADAKRADTRKRRLEKILPMIRAGIGLNDKYRKS